MDTAYSYRKIWSIAYPILISMVMEQLIGMTDTAFLGRVGEIELGASAIAGVYYLVIFMLGLGFSIGVQIIIGRRNGEGKFRETGQVFWHGFYFLSALAVVITILSEWISPKIMGMIISSPQILSASMDYVRWRIIGLIFGFTTAMFRAFYVGTTQTKALTANSIAMVLSNIAFNWILIFGKFGVPALGITGAAIGSTLAEAVSLIFFLIYTRKCCDTPKYGLDKPVLPQWKVMSQIFSVSLWTMVQNFISISTWFIFFLFIEHTGERSLAISNIIRNISGLIWMVLMAFSSTGSTMVSNMIGDSHPDHVIPLIKRILKFSYMIILPILLLFNIFPEAVIRIYTNMPEIIQTSVPSLRVLCAAYIITIPANVFFQAVSGTGNTKTAFALELCALAVYTIYCWFVIEMLKSDVAVCWTAEGIYGLILAVSCWIYIRSGRWKGRKI